MSETEQGPGTVWQLVADNARRHPDKVAYVQVDDDRRRYVLRYAEVAERARKLSDGLFGIGVRRGDRVAVLMTNRPEWIVTYFALLRLGAVLVPLNTWLTPPEIGYLLRQSEARHLVVQDRFRKLDFVGALTRVAPEFATAPPGAFSSPELPELRCVVVLHRTGAPGHDNLYQWAELADGDAGAAAAAAVASDAVAGGDLAMIKYTSGSTGRPKGVMLDQGGIVRYGQAHTERLGLTADDAFFSAMPFFHAGGSLWGIQTMLQAGGRLVFTEAFDPPLAGELIESEKCTVLFGILANELVTSALQAGRDFSAVRMSRPGGHGADALMPNARLVINPFGLTECYGAVTLCGPDDPPAKQRRTNGRPLRGQEIKAVDPETGAEVAPGVVGEAWVRGNTMRGYWKNPEATAAMIDDDGWVHSEDLVSIDADGYVTYASRLKLMLKVGGENVSVEEVERTIAEHEAVLHCVVVGVPDPRKTEIGRAYVIRHEGAELDEATLLAWLGTRLARFKVPREVVFVDSLPRLGSNKFDRVTIQQLALSQAPAGALAQPHGGAMTVSDAEVFERFPDVLINYDNIEHYRGLLERRLLINRCDECGYWIYPHRPLCPQCWSWSVTPTEVSGRGRIHLLTQIRHTRANDRAGQRQGAVVLVGVELAEQAGLRYLSTVDGAAFDGLRHDMPVELTWIERGGQPAPAFRPAEPVQEATVG